MEKDQAVIVVIAIIGFFAFVIGTTLTLISLFAK